MERQLNLRFNAGPADHPVTGFIVKDDEEERSLPKGRLGGAGKSTEYRSGQFSGYELSRSHKLDKDPIMELKHIIGYEADKCFDIRWSK